MNNSTDFEESLDTLIHEENDAEFVQEQGQVHPTPQVKGEQSISGHMPSPDSDDDIEEQAHAVGIHLDETEDTPTELNIGKDIADAEQAHRHGS